VLVAAGGPGRRRAAVSGLASLGVTSAIVYIGLKPVASNA
jgi:hypothetical protein